MLRPNSLLTLIEAIFAGSLTCCLPLYVLPRRLPARWYGPLSSTVTALGMAAALWVLRGFPLWMPRDDLDRIFLWVLPLAWLVELPTKWFHAVVWLWRWVGGVVVMRLVLHGSVYVTDQGAGSGTAWSTWQAAQHLGGFSLAWVLAWLSTYALLRYQPGFNSGYVLGPALLASAMAALLGGYISCAMHLIVVAGVALAMAWVRGPALREPGGPTAEGIVWFLWLSLLTSAHYFADLPWYAALLLIAAPAAAWLGVLPWHRIGLRRVTATATYLGPLIVLTAVLIQLYLSIQATTPTTSPPSAAGLQDYLQFGK